MGRKKSKMEKHSTTIEKAEMYVTEAGALAIAWRICYDDGRMEWRVTTQKNENGITNQRKAIREGGRKGHTQAWRNAERDLKKAAKKTAARLFEKDEARRQEEAARKAAGKARRVWTKKDKAGEYIDEVSMPALGKDKRIRESTRYRYRKFLMLVRDAAGDMTVREWLNKRYLKEELFQGIADGHGVATARSAYSVTCKYVLNQMSDDDLVTMATWPFPPKWKPEFDPEAKSHAKTRRAKENVKPTEVLALTAEERERVIEWLVAQGECKTASGHGMTAEQATYRRRELVDMTLLQATCGLRLHEAITLTVGRVRKDKGGYAVVEVTDEGSKTHRGREVSAALDARWGREVSDRLLARCRDLAKRGLGDDACVFGACKSPGSPWSQDNASKGPIRRFYDEMAEACDVPVLKVASTHVWRATLATEYAARYAEGTCSLDPLTRAKLFGHSVRVENDYYTKDVSPEQQRTMARPPAGGSTLVFRPEQGRGRRATA